MKHLAEKIEESIAVLRKGERLALLISSIHKRKPKSMNNDEHKLQCACVQWFNLQHRDLRGLLFAVPNGSYRNKATAGKLKAEGVVAGVADLILLVPRMKDIEPVIHGLCIEMKTAKGRQSPEQKAWQSIVEAQGYRYAVCRSFDDFTRTVNEYLGK